MGSIAVSNPVAYGIAVIDALMWLLNEKGVELFYYDAEEGQMKEAGGCYEALPGGQQRLRRDIAEAAARMVTGGWRVEGRPDYMAANADGAE